MKLKTYGILLIIFLFTCVGLYANYAKEKMQPYVVANEIDVVGNTESIRLVVGETKTFTAAEFGANQVRNVENNSSTFGQVYVGGSTSADWSSFTLSAIRVTDGIDYYVTLNLDGTNKNIPCKVVEPQFKFAKNAKIKIKRDIFNKYILDNNGNTFPSGYAFADSTQSDNTGVLNVTGLDSNWTEMNLDSIDAGNVTLTVPVRYDEGTKYNYSVKVDYITPIEVNVGDNCTTQLFLNTQKDNFGNVAGSNYYTNAVSYPEGMIDENWKYKTPGTYTFIVHAGNSVQINEKKAFMYTIKVNEAPAEPITEISIDKARDYARIGYKSQAITVDNGYYHVNDGADPTNVTIKSSNDSIAEVNDDNTITAKGYGKATITIASKEDETIKGTFEFYSIATNRAYVGNECTCEVPAYDEDGEPIDYENITSMTSENPNVFTVEYTPNDNIDMCLTGITAGLDKLKIIENNSEIHYTLVESFDPVKVGTVNKNCTLTFNELKNAKNYYGYAFEGESIDYGYAYNPITEEEFDLDLGEDSVSFTPTNAGLYLIELTSENGEEFSYYVNITDTIAVESLTLDKEIINLIKWNREKIKASILPKDATNKEIVWEIEDPTIAAVVNGKVRGIGVGTTTITCRSLDNPDAYDTCVVNVEKVAVNIVQNKVNMKRGNQVQLGVIVTPLFLENKDVTWVSSNTSVAVVTQDGVVLGLKKGTAKIKAISKYDGKTYDTVTINVYNK